MLRAIALLKGLQAIVLFGIALAAFHLLRPEVALVVQGWAHELPAESERGFLQGLGRWVSGLLPHQIAGISAGAFLYGVLFTVESVGLWQRKIWAEWLTVIATGLLVPLELWEVLVRISPLRVIALVVNVAVVWYLIRQLRRNVARHARHGCRAPDPADLPLPMRVNVDPLDGQDERRAKSA